MKLGKGFWAVVLTLLSVIPVAAFLKSVHQQITQNVLGTACRTIDNKTLCFTARAIGEVSDANRDTDSIFGQNDASRHFDSEAFLAGSTRLITLKEDIIANITKASPNGSGARDSLGRALHTVQDFYAHSSWVDDFSGTDQALGLRLFDLGDPGPPPVARIDQSTCTSDHNTLAGVGLTSITSGYFRLEDPCFSGPTDVNKCRHGGFDFIGARCPNGISKDHDGRPNFGAALAAASTATQDFLSQILDYDGSPLPSGNSYPAVANNVKATKALMGLKFSLLGAVIDDTGSMFDIIDQVKAQVGLIVQSVLGTDNEPDKYLLEVIS